MRAATTAHDKPSSGPTGSNISETTVSNQTQAGDQHALVPAHASSMPNGLPPEVLSLLEEDFDEPRHLAQEYRDGQLSYGFRAHGKIILVKSRGPVECFSAKESAQRGFIGEGVQKGKISKRGLQFLMEGQSAESPMSLFSRVRGHIKTHVSVPEEGILDMLACWTMGTYLFTVFSEFPYLHFNGEKQSGKSVALELLARLSFNGVFLVNFSEAVLFRSVQRYRPSLFLDEVERLGPLDFSVNGGLMQILNSGYKSSGSTMRCGGKDYTSLERFSTYGPKALGGIRDIDDTLRDRTFTIRMTRALCSDSIIKYGKSDEILAREQALRDSLFMFGVRYAPAIASVYYNAPERLTGASLFHNREAELILPLLAVAAVVDAAAGERTPQDQATGGPVSSALVELGKKWHAERQAADTRINPTTIFLTALCRAVEELHPLNEVDQMRWYDPEELRQCVLSHAEGPLDLTRAAFSSRLARHDIATEPRRVEGKSMRVCLLNMDKLRTHARRYGALNEEETVAVA